MSVIPYANPATPPLAAHGFVSRYLREISVACAYCGLLLMLGVIRPTFFQAQFFTTWVSAVPVLVAAVGMTLIIIARQIDISIGSQFSVCGIVAGLLAERHFPIPVILCITLATGAVMGAINGALVAYRGLPSIVVTLATMVIIRGALLWLSQGAAARLPEKFQWFGASQHVGQRVIIGIAVMVFAMFAWASQWLGAGRAVYAVGSDQEAARLAGIHPKRVIFNVFVLMGALTGLAALLNAAQFRMIYPDVGKDLELQVIAAVVVGGTAITGGRGTLVGTLIGVALLATIGPALIFFHAHSQWAKAIAGMIILLAVATDGLQRRAN